ncbi:MAG TPA: hypothetical protein VGH33_24375 [Isosphaeraceae bacterium]
MSTTLPELYLHDRFLARRQVFKLFGGAFHLYAEDGRLLAYSKQKAFRLKEDIRVFADEAMSVELLSIQADRIIDWSAAYQVYDGQSGEHYGTLRRKGWASLWRDHWEILDDAGVVRGRVIEESGGLAFLRRMHEMAAMVIPQMFVIQVGDVTVGMMKQNFNPFVRKYAVDLTHDSETLLPRPLAVAAVILLLAIEGRQGDGG